MSRATVYAVMKVTIEVPVRASGSEETLQQMHDMSVKEARGILEHKLGREFRVVGQIEFSHAIVKANNP